MDQMLHTCQQSTLSFLIWCAEVFNDECRPVFAIALCRIYVVFCSEAIGGEDAARAISMRVSCMINFRKVSKPLKASLVLDRIHVPRVWMKAAFAELQVQLSVSFTVSCVFRFR